MIDGHDSRDIQVKALRQQVGVVLQDPFLFQGTIAENIGYSKPGASRREIIARLRVLQTHTILLSNSLMVTTRWWVKEARESLAVSGNVSLLLGRF